MLTEVTQEPRVAENREKGHHTRAQREGSLGRKRGREEAALAIPHRGQHPLFPIATDKERGDEGEAMGRGEDAPAFPVTCAPLQHPRVLRRRCHHPKTPPSTTQKMSQWTLKPSPGSSSGAGGGSLPRGYKGSRSGLPGASRGGGSWGSEGGG
jgi:hypothetical protein